MNLSTGDQATNGHHTPAMEVRSRNPVSFTRTQWLTLTMLADLLQFKEEQLEVLAQAEADGVTPPVKRMGDRWLDNKIRDVAHECRSRGLDEQVATLGRQYPALTHLLAFDPSHSAPLDLTTR